MDPRGGVKDYVRLPVFHLSFPTEVEGALLYGGGFAAFLEDGNLVSQPSPLGEGAPQGRIGYWRYEREREGTSQAGDL